jgi:hypothetical protein
MQKWLLLSVFGTLLNQALCADSWYCQTASLTDIMQNNNQISYMPCKIATAFEHKKLPLTDNHFLHPYNGFFTETFILTIPQGKVFGRDGWVLVNDILIQELIWQNVYLPKHTLQEAKKSPPLIKKGRVAVITQTGYHYYYHWLVEVLGRLALLEMQGIEYDFIYVPTHLAYMKQTLALWGIDSTKIIEASDDYILEADELIVPSLVSSVIVAGCPRLVHYIPSYIVQYIRAKLLNAIKQYENVYQFNTKIFISRQDASARNIINEDEVFALLEQFGFQRYHLTKMSIKEQIILFKNAEIIIGPLGSGLSNILFCNPDVKMRELYQARRDCTIWNLSQMVGIHDHQCIQTTDFIDENEGQYNTFMSLDIIKEVITSLL